MCARHGAGQDKPGYAMPYCGLVAVEKVRPDDDLIPPIERLLRDGPRSATDRSHLNFALGKCFDDTGAFDRAFRHDQTANGIRKAARPFDAAAFAEDADRLTNTFRHLDLIALLPGLRAGLNEQMTSTITAMLVTGEGSLRFMIWLRGPTGI